jgi:hypothetical protein
MTNDEIIRRLEGILNDEMRFENAAYSKRRRMRPSERAMTVAHYQMNIRALQEAIVRLREQPAEKEKV